ncbi:MAG: hypothetical protein ACYTEK_09120, partial [Planctomycetota bacterium]
MARSNKRQVENGRGGQNSRTRAGSTVRRPLREGKRFWVIASLLLVVTVASVLLGWMRMPAAADADKATSTFTVRTDDLTITVTESGSIKAQESTDVM